MYNPNFNTLLQQEIPVEQRKPFTIAWLQVLAHGIKSVHGSFYLFVNSTDRVLNHNFQVKELEKYLNDIFDGALRRIFIDNAIDLSRPYIYNKIEQKPPFYLYNKWSPVKNYIVGEYVVDGDNVYVARVPNIGHQPSISSDWRFYKSKPIVRNKEDYDLQYDFIVNVPASLVFDVNYMKAEINRIKWAGLRYTIQNY